MFAFIKIALQEVCRIYGEFAKAHYFDSFGQKFWSFVKRTRDDTSLPSSMYLTDEEASDGRKISSFFAKRFNTDPLVDNFVIIPSLLSSAISDLTDNFHAGLDELPSDRNPKHHL